MNLRKFQVKLFAHKNITSCEISKRREPKDEKEEQKTGGKLHDALQNLHLASGDRALTNEHHKTANTCSTDRKHRHSEHSAGEKMSVDAWLQRVEVK